MARRTLAKLSRMAAPDRSNMTPAARPLPLSLGEVGLRVRGFSPSVPELPTLADGVAKGRAPRACVGACFAKGEGRVASARAVGHAHRGNPHRDGRDRKARVEDDHRVGARRAVRSDLGGGTRAVWGVRGCVFV